MKALVCEMCNSNDLIKTDGAFVCQNCGTKYSVEEAKKMMVEGTVEVQGTVKVDSSDELKNLYEIARRAKMDNNSENAQKYYDMILVKDPTSWEAAFYVVYFKSMQTNILNMYSATVSVDNCLKGVFSLIEKKVEGIAGQEEALKEIIGSVSVFATMILTTSINHYEGIDSSIRDKYFNEMVSRCTAAINLMYNCGTYIDEIFTSEKLKKQAANAWRLGISLNGMKKYNSIKDNTGLYTEKIVNMAIRNPELYTKDELEEIKKYPEKICQKYKNLKSLKENKGKNIIPNTIAAAILSAIFSGLVFVFTGLFAGEFEWLDIHTYIFLISFVILAIIVNACGGTKLTIEEIDAKIAENESIIKKIDDAISNK